MAERISSINVKTEIIIKPKNIMKNSYKEALDLALTKSKEEPNNPVYVYPDIFGCWYAATFIGGAPVDFPFKAVCENGKILREVQKMRTQYDTQELLERMQSLYTELKDAIASENCDQIEAVASHLSYLHDDLFNYSHQLRHSEKNEL